MEFKLPEFKLCDFELIRTFKLGVLFEVLIRQELTFDLETIGRSVSYVTCVNMLNGGLVKRCMKQQCKHYPLHPFKINLSFRLSIVCIGIVECCKDDNDTHVL